jgi:putative SOS response-associated peptidase YedK
MCGRYTITADADRIAWRFGAERPAFEFEPAYNAAPSQRLPVITESNGRRQVVLMRWGLIPSWAKDISIGNKMINARIETVEQKPSFKKPLLHRRCLIPADGYYEWMKIDRRKQPLRIVASHKELFSFAGIYDRWVNSDGLIINSFSILTTEPIPPISHIHNRMPLILSAEQEQNWLDGPSSPEASSVREFLNEFYPYSSLFAYPVSTLVNNPRVNEPSLISPMEQTTLNENT